ncbi:hypothetical protein BDQ17DRAFT_1387380 [Cyathus striatus]|nr:hypothetical protein BDQ17DRAFT_1387380 [Cyathus striatus]
MSLTLVNLISPSRKIGHVTLEGHPGAGGKWPEYIPPKEGDSRCSCPALNAMANHGVPSSSDGKNIGFKEMGDGIRQTYNFSPTFCWFVPNYAAEMLKRSYKKDTLTCLTLTFITALNTTLLLPVREDSAIVPDQSKPHVPYIKELLSYATGKDSEGNAILTPADLARYSSKRRADARASNPDFTLAFIHKMFGSSKPESILIDERIPDGWESRIRKPLGLTMTTFNRTVFRVEMGTNEKKYLKEKAATTNYGATALPKCNWQKCLKFVFFKLR